MKAGLFPPPSLRRLLPDQRRRSAPWIVGLMTFVSLVVGAAGISVIGAVRDLQGAAEGRWSLQVTGIPADAARTTAMLAAAPEVAEVKPVPEAELRKTLRQWLGPAADTLDLPLPALADVTMKSGADGAALARRLQAAIPAAHLTSYSAELRPLLATLQGLALVVVGLLVVLAAALAGAVTLAARATLEANRATLDVLHGIGATDAQLLGLVQRRLAIDALVGSAVGALAAALVIALALIPARGLLAGWSERPLLGPSDLLLLILLPFAQAALATLVARWTLQRTLAAAL